MEESWSISLRFSLIVLNDGEKVIYGCDECLGVSILALVCEVPLNDLAYGYEENVEEPSSSECQLNCLCAFAR